MVPCLSAPRPAALLAPTLCRVTVKVLLQTGREDVWEDRPATHGQGAARFDFRVEDDRTLAILDISQGETAAREVARYQLQHWIRASRSPDRARIRRIQVW